MELTLTMFMSLDGVVQIPDGPPEPAADGLDLAGWRVPYGDREMTSLFTDWFARADAFLLGRVTYQIFAANWPHVDPGDPVGARLNSSPKYVASRTLDSVDWTNSRLVTGDLATQVASLKDQPGRELQVHGSPDLAQTLIGADLVDEYRLFTYPAVLGRGKRLFRDGSRPAALHLADATTTGTGVTVHTYRRAGEPRYRTG